MIDGPSVVQLLLQANRLKQTPRTGWALRGIPAPENVASHSYGAAFTALALSEVIPGEFDLGRLLALAILHDLPEGTSSDIPAPAWEYVAAGVKKATEDKIMDEILSSETDTSLLRSIWSEWQDGVSDEARLVDDADKIDRYLQAMVYEKQTGNLMLGEFWVKPAEFHFPESQALYEELKSRRTAR